jgi:hypothetical protein
MRGYSGVPRLAFRVYLMHIALAVVIDYLRYPMVVWVTLQSNPSVVAIRVADAVMPK